MLALIEKLEREGVLTESEFVSLIEGRQEKYAAVLAEKAVNAREKYYGRDVFIRGLIEFTNYCKNDCFYCGIRRSNKNTCRYRLSEEEILSSCERGYSLGFRTFVLQGGEDPYFTPERIKNLIVKIKSRFPDCALTLSVGEKPYEVYKEWYDAGADRYLLRHETADEKHYSLLHPASLSLKSRKQCLYDLKKIGYQVGCGFMVGSPHQTSKEIAKDLLFIKEFSPDMVGIGPFIPQKDTPFKDEKRGSMDMTLYLLSIIRLMLPSVLLPATTALQTIDEKGLQKGLLAGANVCMPNISPKEAKERYVLYDGKFSGGDEIETNLIELHKKLNAIGYNINPSRGDRRKEV